MEKKFYKAETNLSICYSIEKSKASCGVIVFLHGLASNMSRWSEFVEFTSLTRKWDIITIDLRGHGLSSYRGDISMEKWCSDIIEILSQEGYKDAIIVGHCLGANIAANFGILYPQKCRGLIFLEPIFSESIGGFLGILKNNKFILTIILKVIKTANSIGLFRRKIPLLSLREMDLKGREIIKKHGDPEALKKIYGNPIHDLRYIPLYAYFQSLRELLKPFPEMIDSIPKLFIFSSGRLFGESLDLKKILSKYKNSDVTIIDSFHWIPTEKPAELKKTIEEWIKKHNS
ncbi:MAG: alpha/beta hydrolase [Spirochaetes bacterium]|jgi:pimeloyl-ACP methyl ester carboxylesterase|nr:alpha/beta hydrolase [Spirochaetota bacterium]